MTPHLSPATKRVFATADLFGYGGKRENASLAALIVRSITEIVAPEAMPHRRKIRQELSIVAQELEYFAEFRND